MSSNTTPTGHHAGTHTSSATGANAAGIDSVIPKVAGGAPARIYLNEKITPYLLEGLKDIAREQPQNPLKVLGEYLIKKSNEVEQGQNNGQ